MAAGSESTLPSSMYVTTSSTHDPPAFKLTRNSVALLNLEEQSLQYITNNQLRHPADSTLRTISMWIVRAGEWGLWAIKLEIRCVYIKSCRKESVWMMLTSTPTPVRFLRFFCILVFLTLLLFYSTLRDCWLCRCKNSLLLSFQWCAVFFILSLRNNKKNQLNYMKAPFVTFFILLL